MAKAEDALTKKNFDWEQTFDCVPDLIAIIDARYKIVRVNKAMARRLGREPEKLIGMNCFECMHGTDFPPDFCPHSKTLQDGLEHVAELNEPCLGGYFIISTTPLKDEQNRIIGSVHVVRDITERKKVEDSLQSALKRFESLIEVTGIIGWTTNADGEVVEDVPSFRKFTGQKYADIKGWGWAKAIHPDDMEQTKRVWRNAILTKSKYEIEYRLRRHDGVYRFFIARGVPVLNEDGTVKEWVGTCIDITDRKQMEEELRDTLEAAHCRQREVSALLKASKAVLQHREFKDSARAIFDCCKELLGATSGYVALLGKDNEENEVLFLDSGGLSCTVDHALSMPIQSLHGDVYREGKVIYYNDFARSRWQKLIPEGHLALRNVLFSPLLIESEIVGLIALANKPGGFTERDAVMAAAFGKIASVALINSRILETLEDTVEERTKQLKESERFAVIGATASMVGHDIRNPLQAIVGDLYLLESDVASFCECEEKESIKESIESIKSSVDYIDKIVQDLQDFARPLQPTLLETDFEDICQIVLFKNECPENVKVSLEIEKEAKKLVTDPTMLRRIMTNLMNNAIQAMPNGGKLEVRSYREPKGVVITLQDYGVGVPEEARAKLFTPLFTTKSKGQGFGLAVVKRMTEALGGTVTFESEVGKGTKFILRIPNPKKL